MNREWKGSDLSKIQISKDPAALMDWFIPILISKYLFIELSAYCVLDVEDGEREGQQNRPEVLPS